MPASPPDPSGRHRATAVELRAVRLPDERPQVEAFLRSSTWPFHVVSSPTDDTLAELDLEPPETAAFWVVADGDAVGLARIQGLDDLDDGCPTVDLRLGTAARGRGVGRAALARLADRFFATFPVGHRLEGHTRDDNAAMRRVFDACGWQLEGRLRRTWPTADGPWADTCVYGLLREDWEARGVAGPGDGQDTGRDHDR